MVDREEIMRKVGKLLRLGQSPNAHEAAAAVAKAHDLAMAYGVEIEACRAADADDVEEDCARSVRLTDEEGIMSGVVDRHFAVRCLQCEGRGTLFFGERVNIALARHVFGFLVAEVRRGMDARGLYRPDKRRSYAAAFAMAVEEKLGESPIRNDAKAGALVLAAKARIDAKIARTYTVKERGHSGPKKRLDEREARAGFEHGLSVDVRRPLGDARERAGALLAAHGGRGE